MKLKYTKRIENNCQIPEVVNSCPDVELVD